MGCNSSNQVGSAPPNANLPSKQRQTKKVEAAKEAAAKAKLKAALDEAGDDLEKIETQVAAAKAALEAALEEETEDQDKVMALAEAAARGERCEWPALVWSGQWQRSRRRAAHRTVHQRADFSSLRAASIARCGPFCRSRGLDP